MTKKSDLRLDREPINMREEKETPAERLVKLQNFLTEEENCANPCATYIEDLNTSIDRIKRKYICVKN